MTIDLSTLITYFSGGMILSSTFFIIHLICTINPYHKVLFPLISSLLGFLIGILIITNSSESNYISTIREVISKSVIIIISVSPIILALLTYNFYKISFIKKDSKHIKITKL